MKKLLKFIKSIFRRDKYSAYINLTNKGVIVRDVIINRVTLANTNNNDYMFSIIPTKNYVTIKCQTYNDIYSSVVLSLTHCGIFSEEELVDYIDKELNVLIKETNSLLNCYKASKNEKDN